MVKIWSVSLCWIDCLNGLRRVCVTIVVVGLCDLKLLVCVTYWSYWSAWPDDEVVGLCDLELLVCVTRRSYNKFCVCRKKKGHGLMPSLFELWVCCGHRFMLGVVACLPTYVFNWLWQTAYVIAAWSCSRGEHPFPFQHKLRLLEHSCQRYDSNWMELKPNLFAGHICQPGRDLLRWCWSIQFPAFDFWRV
jgi:hypothetical protein